MNELGLNDLGNQNSDPTLINCGLKGKFSLKHPSNVDKIDQYVCIFMRSTKSLEQAKERENPNFSIQKPKKTKMVT